MGIIENIKRVKKEGFKNKKLEKCLLVGICVILIFSAIFAVYSIYFIVDRVVHHEEYLQEKFPLPYFSTCIGNGEKVYFNETYPEIVCGQVNPFLAEDKIGSDIINWSDQRWG